MLWKFLSKTLKATGGIAFVALSLVFFYLIYRWRATRPYLPNPTLGLTTTLPWCLGAYGTAGERDFLNWCQWCVDMAGVMFFSGMAIDYYKFGVFPLRSKAPRLKL